jgi:hypothetical protein
MDREGMLETRKERTVERGGRQQHRHGRKTVYRMEEGRIIEGRKAV